MDLKGRATFFFLFLSPGSKVDRVEGSGGSNGARAVLADGSAVYGRKGVVVAVEGPEARRLLGSAIEVMKAGRVEHEKLGCGWGLGA